MSTPQAGVPLASLSSSFLMVFLPPSPTSSCLLHRFWAVTLTFVFSWYLSCYLCRDFPPFLQLTICQDATPTSTWIRCSIQLSNGALCLYLSLRFIFTWLSRYSVDRHLTYAGLDTVFNEDLESGQYNSSSSLLKTNGEIMQTVFEERGGEGRQHGQNAKEK